MAGKTMIKILMLLALIALAGGCGSDDPAAPVSIDTAPPAVPTNLTANYVSANGGVILSWDANTVDADLAGYVIDKVRSGVTTPLVTTPILVADHPGRASRQRRDHLLRVRRRPGRQRERRGHGHHQPGGRARGRRPRDQLARDVGASLGARRGPPPRGGGPRSRKQTIAEPGEHGHARLHAHRDDPDPGLAADLRRRLQRRRPRRPGPARRHGRHRAAGGPDQPGRGPSPAPPSS